MSNSTFNPTSYKCPISGCVFVGISMPIVISHLRLVHASDPNFSVPCGIEGCYTTFKSFSSFYQHIYRKHPDAGIIRARKEQHLNVVHPAQPFSPVSPQVVESIPEGKNIAIKSID